MTEPHTLLKRRFIEKSWVKVMSFVFLELSSQAFPKEARVAILCRRPYFMGKSYLIEMVRATSSRLSNDKAVFVSNFKYFNSIIYACDYSRSVGSGGTTCAAHLALM